MCPQSEVFTSSRGYQLGISNTGSHQRKSWIEISIGKSPIRVYFNSICSHLSSTNFDFCSFISWDPYFAEFSSAISGIYFEEEIHLKWVMMVNSDPGECTVISSGNDLLIRSPEQSCPGLMDRQVPHPFNIELLKISTDRIRIEAAPGQEWLRDA